MKQSLRDLSLNRLSNFIYKGLDDYAFSRNYDLGPSNRSNISFLSPYIRKRIIHEKEVILNCLNKFKLNKIEKFIQEVFWRVYWKGWLEGRPQVWNDYKKKLNYFQKEYSFGEKKKRFQRAIEATSGIECFDDWVKELIKYGYLHNHSRMWFASIWVHTLNLPWELGANFFLTHLLDADPASNTLSWRWVAGLHTEGKVYLANEDNIKKFTKERYTKKNILKKEIKLPEFKRYNFFEKNTENFLSRFENNLVLLNINNTSYLEETIEFLSKNKVCYVKESDFFNFAEISSNFNQKSIKEYLDFLKNKSIEINIFDTYKDLLFFLKKKNIGEVFSFYPAVGYELDYLNKQFTGCTTKLKFIYDTFDNLCWKFANSGFFKFKKKIPYLISRLDS